MNHLLLSATSVNGTDVKNRLDEDLGHIKDLMIDTETGRIEYAVLSFGGFLGVGDKYFAVPWNAFTIDTAKEEFILDVTKDKLDTAPGFDKDNWPEHAASDYFRQVNEFYDRPSVPVI